MTIPRMVFVALGAAAAELVRSGGKGKGGRRGVAGFAGLGNAENLHDGVVHVVAAGMRLADKVGSVTQTLADEAADINVEARQKARIDAAVRERLAQVEDDIRAEVVAEFDETDMDY